jgi:hypothetical protein
MFGINEYDTNRVRVVWIRMIELASVGLMSHDPSWGVGMLIVIFTVGLMIWRIGRSMRGAWERAK